MLSGIKLKQGLMHCHMDLVVVQTPLAGASQPHPVNDLQRLRGMPLSLGSLTPSGCQSAEVEGVSLTLRRAASSQEKLDTKVGP